jgi:hypothetical protein
MKYSFIAGLTISLVSIAACEKDKSEPSLSRTDLITSGNWIRTKQTEEHNGFIDPSNYESRPNCFRDNEFIFRKDSSHAMTEGKTKCDQNLPDVVDTGTWMFKNEEKYLRVYWRTGGALEYEITKLTKDSMILKVASADYIYTDYYSH